jgi:hypothetical protein
MNQPVCERRLAMVDVGNDGEIADVIHAYCDVRGACRLARGATVKPLARMLLSRSDVLARSAAPKLKKRHVERVTRLPTKCLATACWAFIVAKSTRLETAPLLDFTPLHSANRNFCPQDINSSRPAIRQQFEIARLVNVRVPKPA